MLASQSYFLFQEFHSPIDTNIPIVKPFHVNRGSGVVSYPACSPT
jgi:hypothetical protein